MAPLPLPRFAGRCLVLRRALPPIGKPHRLHRRGVAWALLLATRDRPLHTTPPSVGLMLLGPVGLGVPVDGAVPRPPRTLSQRARSCLVTAMYLLGHHLPCSSRDGSRVFPHLPPRASSPATTTAGRLLRILGQNPPLIVPARRRAAASRQESTSPPQPTSLHLPSVRRKAAAAARPPPPHLSSRSLSPPSPCSLSGKTSLASFR